MEENTNVTTEETTEEVKVLSQKIVLADNTELVITNATSDSVTAEMTAEEMTDFFEKLTVENLSHYEIQLEDNSVIGIYENKERKSCTYADGYATFRFKEHDLLAMRVDALESSQNDQDDIITELAMGE